ncbi:MAG: insulinase family protein, partial [Planctomycetales bacterium]
GAAYDPEDQKGLSNLTCEMALRGCGDRDSRQFIEDLEGLGVESGESVSVSHSTFRGATLAANLFDALGIYSDLLRRPTLPADQLEQGRQVALQELRSIDDEPSTKVMLELRRRHYPHPWGRSHHGSVDGLSAITIEDIQKMHSTAYRPNGTILGIAGRFDWEQLKDHVGQLLGDWPRSELSEPAIGPLQVQQEHLHHESNQTHIAVAYPSVPYHHEDYFESWGAVGVLSDGSSSRLFTEIREKRGLCYSVSASPRTLKNCGSVFCYAGTSADRAQETLDVLLAELIRLSEGIQASELNRLKARMKSALIMALESSMARAGAIARDWYYLTEVRTLSQIGTLVDALTPETINAYLVQNPPGQFTVVTLGPQPLELKVGVS